MMRSTGFRFFIVGLLALLMFIPLEMVSEVVDSRADYSRSTIGSVGREWGGDQLFSGPQLVIPVEEEVTYERRREVVDPENGQTLRDEKNNVIYEHFQETVIESRDSVFLYPNDFKMNVATETQERHRGIFIVPVYTARIEMAFDIPAAQASTVLIGNERLKWNDAQLRFYLTSNRALRGEAKLLAGETERDLEPLPGGQGDTNGVYANVGDPRDIVNYSMTATTNGAQHLRATGVGRTSKITITSDWPHPSFFGDFLPDSSDVSDTGFSANWTIPHLARTLPQISRSNPDFDARQIATMGVRFITPNDFYQKAYRSARYGILFIALTFLTILLLDRTSAKPTHPVQYLMVGLAQSVFVLLMLAYAEQIGFGPAYLLASGATIALLVMFGATAMKMGRRTLVLAAMLIVLYAVLYLILQSADYALLAGSTLAFVALAGTMYLTRNEDWYGPERKPRAGGWFSRAPAPAAAAVTEDG